MNNKPINHDESLSVRIGEFLYSKGFCPASLDGIALNSKDLLDRCVFGVLCNDPNETKLVKRRWFSLATQKRRIFLGKIWFDNRSYGASEKNWVFETYFRVFEKKYIELAKELANDMSAFFEVKVDLHLVSRQLGFESYMADHYN